MVHSPFTEQRGTPVQPALAGTEARGTVELFPEFAAALADLEGFERIWLLCWLDRCGPWQPVVTPYLDQAAHGLFATRSPSRPNPLGISCVRLTARRGHVLEVSELDLIDGTPLLDLKPYVPAFDSFPGVRAGWLEGRELPPRHDADSRFAGEGGH